MTVVEVVGSPPYKLKDLRHRGEQIRDGLRQRAEMLLDPDAIHTVYVDAVDRLAPRRSSEARGHDIYVMTGPHQVPGEPVDDATAAPCDR